MLERDGDIIAGLILFFASLVNIGIILYLASFVFGYMRNEAASPPAISINLLNIVSWAIIFTSCNAGLFAFKKKYGQSQEDLFFTPLEWVDVSLREIGEFSNYLIIIGLIEAFIAGAGGAGTITNLVDAVMWGTGTLVTIIMFVCGLYLIVTKLASIIGVSPRESRKKASRENVVYIEDEAILNKKRGYRITGAVLSFPVLIEAVLIFYVLGQANLYYLGNPSVTRPLAIGLDMLALIFCVSNMICLRASFFIYNKTNLWGNEYLFLNEFIPMITSIGAMISIFIEVMSILVGQSELLLAASGVVGGIGILVSMAMVSAGLRFIIYGPD